MREKNGYYIMPAMPKGSTHSLIGPTDLNKYLEISEMRKNCILSFNVESRYYTGTKNLPS